MQRVTIRSEVYEDEASQPMLNLQLSVDVTSKETKIIQLSAGAVQNINSNIDVPKGYVLTSGNVIRLYRASDESIMSDGSYQVCVENHYPLIKVRNVGQAIMRGEVESAVWDDETVSTTLTVDGINLKYAKFIGQPIIGIVATEGTLMIRMSPYTEMEIAITDIGFYNSSYTGGDGARYAYPDADGLAMTMNYEDGLGNQYGYYDSPTPTHLADAIQRCINTAIGRLFVTCTYNETTKCLELNAQEDTVDSIAFVNDGHGYAGYCGLLNGTNVAKGTDVTDMLLRNLTKENDHTIVSCTGETIVVSANETDFAAGDDFAVIDPSVEATVNLVMFE